MANSERLASPKLQTLTFSPLKSNVPFGVEEELPGFDTSRSASYMETRSIPSTPSILSQHSSATALNSHPRSNSHPFLHLETSTFPLQPNDPKGRLPRKKKKHSGRATKPDDPHEWFLRAGAAISSEARESKGQSWLANRASSTSLTPAVDPDEYIISPPRSGAATPRLSRAVSRQQSQRPSRRGSRIGSRVELLTPYGLRTPGQDSPDSQKGKRRGSGYFGDFDHERGVGLDGLPYDLDEYAEGPDFVDPDEAFAEDQEDEDEEMSRLTRERGLGLGGIVDGFFGLSLFAVEEDDDGSRQAPGKQQEQTERLLSSPSPSRDELATEASQAEESQSGLGHEGDLPAITDGATAWQDAAWLFRVATRSIL